MAKAIKAGAPAYTGNRSDDHPPESSKPGSSEGGPADPSADAPTEPQEDSVAGRSDDPVEKAKEDDLRRQSRTNHEKGRPKNTGRMGA